MKKLLSDKIAAALSPIVGIEEAAILPLLERPKNTQFGDLAFPCFLLAKSWKVSPVEAAKKLAAEVALPEGVEQANAQGPFLNFRFNRAWFAQKTVAELLTGDEGQQQDSPARLNADGRNVVVEYSSPNIAKPFHVGHLRATLIGNCLDRVYRACGWNTVSVNHLGDWGTQFGFVWAGCKLWGAPEVPTVQSLVELYRKATGLKAAQEEGNVPPEEQQFPDVNEMARQFFLDLEERKPYAVEFWEQCVKVSLEYLHRTYDRLGVRFDHYTGESFYSDKLSAVEEELREAGLLTESQGALGVDLGEQLGFARITTPDGRSLYLTRDLATAKYRAETFNFDRALYVVGAPQSLHFQQLKAILKGLGHEYAERIVHVAFGHVLGMKTRGEGSFIELNEFLDEAFSRALEAYHTQVSKRPEGLDEKEVARSVALAAIIFSTLGRSNIKDVHFSWDHALAFQGDSGPYLLYAYARINGIIEKAAQAGISIDGEITLQGLEQESAFQLASALSDFPTVVEKTAAEYEPAILADYALTLAKQLSKAYLELKVVGEEPTVARPRLLLFEATRRVLGQSLRLLGIQPLERM